MQQSNKIYEKVMKQMTSQLQASNGHNGHLASVPLSLQSYSSFDAMGLQDRRMFNFGTNANFKNYSASRTKEMPMSQNNIDFFEAKRQSSKSF